VFTNFRSTLPRLLAQHEALKDFFLADQDFVVAPADAEGTSGEVAYTISVPLNQAGSVTANLAAIYKVAFIEGKNGEG
jgi:hypothetical protein